MSKEWTIYVHHHALIMLTTLAFTRCTADDGVTLSARTTGTASTLEAPFGL
jgi:hypothetical protein